MEYKLFIGGNATRPCKRITRDLRMRIMPLVITPRESISLLYFFENEFEGIKEYQRLALFTPNANGQNLFFVFFPHSRKTHTVYSNYLFQRSFNQNGNFNARVTTKKSEHILSRNTFVFSYFCLIRTSSINNRSRLTLLRTKTPVDFRSQ